MLEVYDVWIQTSSLLAPGRHGSKKKMNRYGLWDKRKQSRATKWVTEMCFSNQNDSADDEWVALRFPCPRLLLPASEKRSLTKEMKKKDKTRMENAKYVERSWSFYMRRMSCFIPWVRPRPLFHRGICDKERQGLIRRYHGTKWARPLILCLRRILSKIGVLPL